MSRVPPEGHILSSIEVARSIYEKHLSVLYTGGMETLTAYLDGKRLTTGQTVNMIRLTKMGYVRDSHARALTRYGLRYVKLALGILETTFSTFPAVLSIGNTEIDSRLLLKQADDLKAALSRKGYD